MKNWSREIPTLELHDVLSRIMPEYEIISKAPTERTNDPVEAAKLYKSIDAHGNVFLIQNPAAWRFIEREGKGFFHRPKPIFKYNWTDAKRTSENWMETPDLGQNVRGSKGEELW